MGGTGGGFFPDRNRTVKETQTLNSDDSYETDVNSYLGSKLTDFNDRDVAGIQDVLEQVRTELETDIDGTIDTLYGGSVSKHTYLEGISDVDTLVLLNNSELAEKSPNEVKRFLASRLHEIGGVTEVWSGELAVTIEAEGKTIQLLPALRDGQGVRISSSNGNNWSKVNPQRFAEALTKANKRMDGKLVPCIKLAKALIANLPEGKQMTGYHVESMAINVFREYRGRKTHKAMLSHFYENAVDHVKKPIKDSSGQSVYVDEYLGNEGSSNRKTVASGLKEIRNKIRRANGTGSRKLWEDLFE